MRTRYSLLSLLSLFVFSSCLNYAARKTGLTDSAPKLQPLTVPGKEVYFIGMMHLARKEFYDNTRKLITDLQDKGFVFYLEGVSGYGDQKVAPDTLSLLKFRRLTGLTPSRKYSKEDNPVFQKLVARYDLVDQPDYRALGVRSYRWVDISIHDLMRIYEFKRGPIVLDSCDYRTSFSEPYSCKGKRLPYSSDFMNSVGMYERNRFIAYTIRNSADQKIVVLYGKLHFEGLEQELKAPTQAQ